MSATEKKLVPDPINVIVWYNEKQEKVLELENIFIQRCRDTGRVFEVYGEEMLRAMYREYIKHMRFNMIEERLDSIMRD